jgi:hypothetical protein
MVSRRFSKRREAIMSGIPRAKLVATQIRRLENEKMKLIAPQARILCSGG